MKLTGAQLVVEMLKRHKIKTITGLPGGANLPLYDALALSGIQHILARHEQGAGFMSHGMARTTGEAAVCFATSGPGATNLITAIADAKMDSVPMISITGQVPSGMIGTDAFQEVDTYGMSIPVTKHNFLIKDIAEIPFVIKEAFRLAVEGRPGPVLVDIPKDIQKQEIEIDEAELSFDTDKPISLKAPSNEEVDRMVDAICNAKRPVLWAGGGIVASNSSELLRELAAKNSLPVVTSLMGLGIVRADDPLNIGMLGMHGGFHTNHILEEADLLIALGVRFDDRATGKVEEFCKHASVIHIDVDDSEIDKIRPANIALRCDLKEALTKITQKITRDERSEWLAKVESFRKKMPIVTNREPSLENPDHLIRTVAKLAPEDAIITTDVGQHQMWVAQHYSFNMPRTFLTSGGLGTMGFGLPAAIGAALANPSRKVICFSGDGSFLMNIQELATLAELDIDVTTIILNNKSLGLVRQQQELFYNKNFFASQYEKNPDFAAISRGFGVDAFDLENNEESLKKAIESNKAVVINASIYEDANVLPMVPPGAANKDMIGGSL